MELLRNPDSPEAKDVAIIPPFIAKGIIDLLHELYNPEHFTYKSAQSLKQNCRMQLTNISIDILSCLKKG
jgi:hypothetical protein